MRNLVLCHGTWGRAHPWHLPGSLLRQEAEAHGFRVFDFLWSGALFGTSTAGPGDPAEAAYGGDDARLLGWLSAGEKLVLQLNVWSQPMKYTGMHEADFNLIDDPDLCWLGHSHALQVLAFACVKGARFKTAVSLSGPIRRDMQRARRYAQDRIGTWIQFADPDVLEDPTIIQGELFADGPFTTELPEGSTIPTPGTGHSGMVNEATWRERYGLWETLAGMV